MTTTLLHPPLKWLGSKLSQSSFIVNESPDIKNLKGRYIEPFVGGGSVWLRYGAKDNILNDNDKDLMFFWSMSNSDFQLFKEIILSIESARTKGGCPIADFKIQAMQAIRDLHPSIDVSTANKIVMQEYARRLTAIEKYKVEPDEWEEIRRMTNTGINAVIYYICRNAWNHAGPEQTVVKTALWFVIRELAYCGIFRLNPLGEMNMSYGGVSYDAKDIMSKIELLEKVRDSDTFNGTRFYNLDFKDFFAEINPTKEDFIFVDPPFINQSFEMSSHRELAEILNDIKSKVIVAARDTDEGIKNLYPLWNQSICEKTGTGVSILGRKRTRNKLVLIKNF